MRLVKVRVNNYRSIQSAESFNVGDYTVLVGPNNEGKSNLMRATVLGLHLTQRYGSLRPIVNRDGKVMNRSRSISTLSLAPSTRRSIRTGATGERPTYEWEHDYPLPLQSRAGQGRTTIRLDFSLSESETEAVKAISGVRLNGTLTIQWSLSSERATIEFLKQGPGKEKLQQAAAEIAGFVSDRTAVHNISAIRTHSRSQYVVANLVSAELKTLESDPDYQAAVARINELRAPAIARVEGVLGDALRHFLPEVSRVSVRTTDESSLLRAEDVLVDDGVLTSLRDKGDGIQSLAALSLMQHLANSRSDVNTILAIEEPEAHLHPDAIHALRAALRAAASTQQVLITTHNPILVNRLDTSSNVIVQRNNARMAKHVSEIRDALGVHASDNLLAAELVVLVEGLTDQTIVTALLRTRSALIDAALESGRLVITPMRGATKLGYHLSSANAQICDTYVVLDNDESARLAVSKAIDAAQIEPRDCRLLSTVGMRESEIEDLLDPALYENLLKNKYGVTLSRNFFRRRGKWSARVEAEFVQQGCPWDDATIDSLKTLVSGLAAATPASAIKVEWGGVLDVVQADIERRLGRAT